MFTLLLCITASGVSLAETPLSRENKLKAAYLFNFTKYIEWPRTSFTQGQANIQVCVHGSAAFIRFFSALANERKVGKQQRYLSVAEFGEAPLCHMVFLQKQPEPLLPVQQNSVVVADSEAIVHPQTAIYFFQQNDKLRFAMKPEQLENAGVVVSSELLKLARIN